MQSTKNIINSKNTIFTKVDKGHTVVAINQDVYISKTNEFISSGNFTIIAKDPATNFQIEFKSVIKT